MLAAMHDRDMHPGQAFCLRLVVENDGMPQRDLAAGLHIAAPTISRMLQSMEKAGLVKRLQDVADQRSRVCSPRPPAASSKIACAPWPPPT